MTREFESGERIEELDQATMMTVLQMIADHDGQWGWYQLDRALAASGSVGIHWPSVMDNLKRGGMVVGSGEAQLAATRYTITNAGREYLGTRESK